MKTNMGGIDRMLRIGIAIAIAILFFTKIISGVLGIALMILAGVFLVTSFIGFCPIYTLFGINTCKTKK
ncbi:MAG: DUF2892 domain-containing protein [Flavobacteriales bacterium]|nr:DUF2892 domain-containing protein [Flavobacteriales bacterium]